MDSISMTPIGKVNNEVMDKKDATVPDWVDCLMTNYF